MDERLDEYLKRLDEDDATEAGTGGSRTENLAEKIEAFAQSVVATTRCWLISNAVARTRYR